MRLENVVSALVTVGLILTGAHATAQTGVNTGLQGRVADPTGAPDAETMVVELVAAHEAVVRTARGVFPIAERASDQVTMDLLTQRMQIHEKTAWMLRSLLE